MLCHHNVFFDLAIAATVKDLDIDTTSCQLTSIQFEGATLKGQLKRDFLHGQSFQICIIDFQNDLIIERGGTVIVRGKNSLELNMPASRIFQLQGDIKVMGHKGLMISTDVPDKWLGGYHNLFKLSSKGNLLEKSNRSKKIFSYMLS